MAWKPEKPRASRRGRRKVKNESTNDMSVEKKVVLVALGLGALYWILESAMHAFLFHKSTLVQRILTPTLNVLWIRLLVLSILTIFVAYAQFCIAQRTRAEEALRESKVRYQSLANDVLNTSPAGCFVLDSDFRVVWMNRALQDFFGLRREEVLGQDKQRLVRERIRDIFEDPERFQEKVLATYDNNTYIENSICHVLPRAE